MVWCSCGPPTLCRCRPEVIPQNARSLDSEKALSETPLSGNSLNERRVIHDRVRICEQVAEKVRLFERRSKSFPVPLEQRKDVSRQRPAGSLVTMPLVQDVNGTQQCNDDVKPETRDRHVCSSVTH
jgi:hypothetical protein